MGTTLADLETESFRESKDDLVAQGPSKPHFQVTKKIIGQITTKIKIKL